MKAVPGRGERSGCRHLAAYDLRVRTVLSPAVVASFPGRVASRVLARGTAFRITVPADRDIADIVETLARAHVEVVEVRTRRVVDGSTA